MNDTNDIIITLGLDKRSMGAQILAPTGCPPEQTSCWDEYMHIGKQESQRLLGPDFCSGPLLGFTNWFRALPKDYINIIHVRANEKVRLVLNIDDEVENHSNEKYVNIEGLNPFVHTSLKQDLSDIISNKSDCAEVKIAVIGLWTESTLMFLLYELHTRFRYSEACKGKVLKLCTCSSLTASKSRVQHYNALSQIQQMIDVKLHDSVSDMQEFLVPRWWHKVKPVVHDELNQLFDRVPYDFLTSNKLLNLSEEDQANMSDVDKQILYYLYRDSSQIFFRKMAGGYSGSWVFRVTSKDSMNHQQAASILKIGSRSSITKERVSFEQVEDILGLSAPHIRDWCECKDRAGIKFAYASMAADDSLETADTPSFRKLYKSSIDGSIQPISSQRPKEILYKTFNNVLGRFYKAAVSEKINLFDAYEFDGKGWSHHTGGSDTPHVVEGRVLELMGHNNNTLHFPSIGNMPNVTSFLTEMLPEVKQSYLSRGQHYVSYVHGDLNGGNILVDVNDNVWLIDYEYTCRTHALKDILKIETDILYEYTPCEDNIDFQDGCKIITYLSRVQDLGKPLPEQIPDLQRPHWRVAWECIVLLRSLTSKIIRERRSPFQSDIVLLRYALHMMSLSLSINQRKLALCGACVWADRIKSRYLRNVQYHVDWIPLNIYSQPSSHPNCQLGITLLPGRPDRGGDLDGELKILSNLGVRNILCMSTAAELESIGDDIRVKCNDHMIELKIYSVASQCTATVSRTKWLCEWILDKIENKKQSVCIVSASGLGRCGTLAACVLLIRNGFRMDPEQAIEIVIRSRGERAIDERQAEFVRQFHTEMRNWRLSNFVNRRGSSNYPIHALENAIVNMTADDDKVLDKEDLVSGVSDAMCDLAHKLNDYKLREEPVLIDEMITPNTMRRRSSSCSHLEGFIKMNHNKELFQVRSNNDLYLPFVDEDEE
ncbi:hypothetical protein AKO1_002866 [Acrasis kona]|uniref:Ternary complex associated domain-containing protein n=1 Tax=Acrasis kona TaxID=1008807 RepID=A0AAW2YKV8_9EUKA